MANSIPKNVILADATALLLRERLRENLGAIYIGKMRKNNAKIVSDVYGALINTVSGVYCRRELFCHKAPNNPRNYMTISDDQIAALRDSGIESRVVIRR
jgi:hypothetical protein